MSNQNNLMIFDISNYPEFNLTELENCMIALNIIFQKVFRLPKSRWPAMKDRTVNIPIYESHNKSSSGYFSEGYPRIWRPKIAIRNEGLGRLLGDGCLKGQ